MKTPVFVQCADGGILVYDSIERAKQYVESPDVEAGEYPMVFDAEGARYRFIVAAPSPRKKGWLTSVKLVPVELEPVETEPDGSEELKGVLAARLGVGSEDLSLRDLVQRAARELPSP